MKHFFNLSSCFLAILSFLFLCAMPARADTVTYSTIGGTWQQVNDTTWSMDKDGDGEADVTLVKNGDEWKYYFTVADPDAEYYGWEEDPENGYEIDGQGSRSDPVIFTKNGEIVNKLEGKDIPAQGGVTVTKQVSGGNKAEDFRFTMTLSSKDTGIQEILHGTTIFGDVTFQDGTGMFYLADGESVTVSGLPEGISYQIEEEAVDGYETSWTGEVAGNRIEGTIQAGTDAALVCTNTWKEPETGGSGSDPENPKGTGSLTIKKAVSLPYGEGETFSFHLVFWGLEPEVSFQSDTGLSFTADSSGIGDVSFSLADGESITFPSLPEGCQYQVMEDANSYTPSYKISGAASMVQQGGKNHVPGSQLSTEKETLSAGDQIQVLFTNTGEEVESEPETVEVQVQKVWEDEGNLSGARPDSITVYLLQGEDVIASARLEESGGWKESFTGLPKYESDGVTEYQYRVQEEPVPGYETSCSSAGTDTGTIFTIVNTVYDTGSLMAAKTVEGDGADKSLAFPFTIHLEKDGAPVSGTYQLDGTAGTKAGTIRFDENGDASFSLKDKESVYIKGLPSGAVYTVTETPVRYYEASGGGAYTGSIPPGSTAEVLVTNTYTPPETCSLTVSKRVEGNLGNRAKQFHFSLYLEDMAYPDTLVYDKGGETGTIAIDRGGRAEFTLADGEEITLSGIIKGEHYQILEDDSFSYTVTYEHASGVLSGDASVSVVNTRNVGLPTGREKGFLAGCLFLLGLAGYAAMKKKKRTG